MTTWKLKYGNGNDVNANKLKATIKKRVPTSSKTKLKGFLPLQSMHCPNKCTDL